MNRMNSTLKTKEEINRIVTNAFLCKEIITVDPGLSNGSISKLADRVETWKMNSVKDYDDLNDFFEYQAEICKLPIIILEKITTFAPDAKNIGRMYRMQKLKRHYSEIRCAIKTNKLRFIEVMPMEWMRYLGIYIKNEEYPIRKRRYQDIARGKYPQINVTLNNCDSLLLIDFMKKKLTYDPLWIQNKIQEPEKNKLTFFKKS